MIQVAVETNQGTLCVSPEAILADQNYQTKEDRQYCKKHGIWLSGPKLGRPSKDKREPAPKTGRIFTLTIKSDSKSAYIIYI